MNFSNFTLDEWLNFLENRHAQEIQLGLTRIKKVATIIELLNPDAIVFSVTGTNGKGSTVAALEAIYHAAGYQVGSFTSPHLISFNERIRVNLQPISDKKLCEAFTFIEESRDDIHLTYFEMATLAALWYFKQFALDVIILEVGVGGRLDSTNIIDSDLAIITTVDFDHQAYLGDTKEAIGFEKAGILRSHKPFIYADDNPPPSSILDYAKKIHAPRVEYSIKQIEASFEVVPVRNSRLNQSVLLPLPKINCKAAAAAVMASAEMSAVLPVNIAQWSKAMRQVSIMGRQQLVEDDISTLFDVAHNPQAVTALAEFIKKYQPRGKVHGVFSAFKDKDLHGLIKPMHSYVDFWYPAVLSSKRAASELLLKTVFQDENCSIADCYCDPLTAYQAAMRQASRGDLIVVYGSFLTVSAVMAHRMERQKEEVQ